MHRRDEPQRDFADELVRSKNLVMLWAAAVVLPFFVFPENGWSLYNSFALIFLLFFISLSITETQRAQRQARSGGLALFALVPLLLFAAGSLIYWIRRLSA